MPTGTLEWLKAFLLDNPYPAFLALSLFVNAVQFSLYIRIQAARLEDWKLLAPVSQEYLRLTERLHKSKAKRSEAETKE
jgi:hypothetical protein